MAPVHFTVPAQYAPFVADVVRRALDEVRLDQTFRADSDPRIQRFASVPDALIDGAATGIAVVAVASPT